MFFEIHNPPDALRPYIYRYVFVHAEGSTDTMSPPDDDPRFVNGKHVQPLLPNYGSLIFVRNAIVDINGTISDGLVLLGANQTMTNLTTMRGWFSGMMVDFEPGGMHALLGIDMHKLSGRALTAREYADDTLLQCDYIFKNATEAQDIARNLNDVLLSLLHDGEDVNYTRLRKVIAACEDANEDISAVEMAEAACLSERQFLRLFRRYVGITPKQFLRLRRFHSTIQDMQIQAAQGNGVDLLSIVLRHGYYDLSHAALEFHDMGCMSPSQFRMLGIPLTDDFSVFFA